MKEKKPEIYKTQERIKKAVLDASSIMRYPTKHSRADKPIVHICNSKAYLVLNKKCCTACVVLDLRDDWSKQWVYKLLGRKLYKSQVVGLTYGLSS